jgi:hypothetical protein
LKTNTPFSINTPKTIMAFRNSPLNSPTWPTAKNYQQSARNISKLPKKWMSNSLPFKEFWTIANSPTKLITISAYGVTKVCYQCQLLSWCPKTPKYPTVQLTPSCNHSPTLWRTQPNIRHCWAPMSTQVSNRSHINLGNNQRSNK